MPMLVIHGSMRTHATSRGRSAAASASTSLNSTTLVVCIGVDLRADVAGLRHRSPVRADHDDRLVDRPVIALAEHEDPRPLLRHAAHAQHPAVGIRRGQRELPVGKSEAALKLSPDACGVLCGQHRRDAALGLEPVAHGLNDRLRRVSRHGSGVAETEVDVGVVVDVRDAVAARGLEAQREGSGQHAHEAHGDAGEERGGRRPGEVPRARIIGDVPRPLAFHEQVQAVAIDGALIGGDGGHASSSGAGAPAGEACRLQPARRVSRRAYPWTTVQATTAGPVRGSERVLPTPDDGVE